MIKMVERDLTKRGETERVLGWRIQATVNFSDTKIPRGKEESTCYRRKEIE